MKENYPIYIKSQPPPVAQLVRAFAPQAEGWEIEFQPRQTQVVKTGSSNFTAKRSALGVSVRDPRR